MTQREADVLKVIETRPDIPTYVIRNILAREKGHGIGLKTGHVLYSCKRLEAAGRIVRTHTSSNSACWRLAEQ